MGNHIYGHAQTVVDNDPDLTVWLYGDPDAKKHTLAQTINVEHPLHQLDFRTFFDAYRDDTPILALQLHPSGWDDRRFENFRSIVTCLKENRCRFTNPVVLRGWRGIVMKDVLNEACIQQFREEGYTSEKAFFNNREIAAMRAELGRFKVEGLLRNVATDGDGETQSSATQNLQICPITPKSLFYRSFQFHLKVISAIRSLIEDPFVFYLDQIFLKPALTGIGTNWHQDNSYFKVSDPTKGTAMWVALHDATIENGTLHVIPSSHLTPFEHRRDPHSDHHIRCEVPDEKAVSIELPAGGVAFFNFGVAHSTRANRTDHERAGLALHFLRSDHIPKNGYKRTCQGNSGGFGYTHLTGPEATGGATEFGEQIAGTWPAQVDRLLAKA